MQKIVRHNPFQILQQLTVFPSQQSQSHSFLVILRNMIIIMRNYSYLEFITKLPLKFSLKLIKLQNNLICKLKSINAYTVVSCRKLFHGTPN